MLGMYSNTWRVEQWLRRRKMPRKPEEGGVGSSGHGVTDCSQFHSDHTCALCQYSTVKTDLY